LHLKKHEDWLREWLQEGSIDGKKLHDPTEWKRQVLGQCKSWIDGGLQPRAMTRDLDWGVKVPVEGADGKVLYVWLDAPIGYITATKAWAAENGKDWKPWWQDEDTKLVNFLAKDNIVFHCIIFPVLLRSHGDFVLPDNIPANEFLNLEGKKISTSRNWAVWLHEYVADFPGKTDELRYVLNAISPEFRDSEFTWNDFQARVNNELVAILGNFVNRILVLTHKFFEGKVPSRAGIDLDSLATDVAPEIANAHKETAQFIEKYRFRDAQQAMMGLARFGNKMLTETEPWKLAKTEKEKAAAVLNLGLQLSANLAVLCRPFLPETSKRLAKMLNLETLGWDAAGSMDMLTEGHNINKPELLFKRIENEEVEAQLEKLKASAKANESTETKHSAQKEVMNFEDFTKMDIRTATILKAERVPKTDKLMKIELDTGLDKRTVVSGIAQHYKAEELPGTKVSVLLNLEPRKIRGVQSQGMILMAEDAEGKLAFVNPDKEMPDGSGVR
jgi:methionyl-tRNA synthetase